MLAAVRSATLVGVWGHPVSVEVHVAPGLPAFTVVGLPDASCREARDRVRAAIASTGLEWPMRRITVNLAPGDLPKAGTGLDLAVATGVLSASGQLGDAPVDRIGMVGELGFVDDVIDPRDTRAAIIRSLVMLSTKVDTSPPKKHGNIPL